MDSLTRIHTWCTLYFAVKSREKQMASEVARGPGIYSYIVYYIILYFFLPGAWVRLRGCLNPAEFRIKRRYQE